MLRSLANPCLKPYVFYFESICMLYLAKAGQCYLWELRRGIVTIMVMSLSHSQALRGNTEINKRYNFKVTLQSVSHTGNKKRVSHMKKSCRLFNRMQSNAGMLKCIYCKNRTKPTLQCWAILLHMLLNKLKYNSVRKV